MQESRIPDARELEPELIGAALRYVAIADWFESRSTSQNDRTLELKAMDVFNRVEAELRETGGRVLRRAGTRQLILQRALEELASR
jgi:hypothetical protein